VTCEHTNPLEARVCGACGEPFLAALSAADATALKLPLVGDLRELTPKQRGLLNVAVGVAVMGLFAVLGILLTLLS
jgi:hypothetical protein